MLRKYLQMRQALKSPTEKRNNFKESISMPQWARTNKVLDGKYPAYLQKLTWQYVNITCIRFFAIRNIFSSKTAKHIRSQIGEIV